MKSGQPNVPTIIEFLNANLKENSTIGFDGKVVSTKFVLDLIDKLKINVNIDSNVDLISDLWKNRPQLPFSLLYKIDTFFSGMEYTDKIKLIRDYMAKNDIEFHIISSLEDQAWLFNLRGNDVTHTPVFLSFTVISNDTTYLFVDQNKIDLTIQKYLDDNDVLVRPYLNIFEHLKNIKNKTILLDFNKVNYQIYNAIYQNNKLINNNDPSLLFKAIKNEVEIKNTKLAHIKDGVAFTKFMYHTKTLYDLKIRTNEIEASNYLAQKRSEQHGFIDLSFNTICAYKEHGAMMHYSATEESNAIIEGDGLLLIDSGGHYMEGTTDITRTIAIGNITDEMKLHFTTVLKSVIALSKAVFLKGCRGVNLDILARGPIWNLLIDYKCGTGHGVGHILSVHEAPNGFRWQIVPERNDSAILQPGMITTNEPGIYLEGKYGIRIENELLCIEKGSTEFGDFLGFETITYAPIDLDAIDFNLLNQEEKDWLNDYHKAVYEKISPSLNEEEIEWLKHYTRNI